MGSSQHGLNDGMPLVQTLLQHLHEPSLVNGGLQVRGWKSLNAGFAGYGAKISDKRVARIFGDAETTPIGNLYRFLQAKGINISNEEWDSLVRTLRQRLPVEAPAIAAPQVAPQVQIVPQAAPQVAEDHNGPELLKWQRKASRLAVNLALARNKLKGEGRKKARVERKCNDQAKTIEQHRQTQNTVETHRKRVKV